MILFYSQWELMETLSANLFPLEEMTMKSRMYESIQQSIGCSARPSARMLQKVVCGFVLVRRL